MKINQIFTKINGSYTDINRIIESNNPSVPLEKASIDEKISDLGRYIQEHSLELSKDLIANKDHEKLYNEIEHSIAFSSIKKQIQKVLQRGKILQLRILKDADQIAKWIDENQNKFSIPPNELAISPEDFVSILHEKKDKYDLPPKCNSILSKLSVFARGLQNKTIAKVHSQIEDIRVVADFINAKNIALKDANLSPQELREIAPYLHYVDMRGEPFEDWEEKELQDFIQNCSNAYQIFIQSDKIKELKQLPPKLQTLDCCSCPNLTSLNVSKNPLLQELDCSNCPLKSLDVSKNPLLQTLECYSCPNLASLNVSNNPLLQTLYCSGCPLPSLDVSNNPSLKTLECEKCPNLLSLGESISNCEALWCRNCPRLQQLPQLPATATVYSDHTDSFTSFNVDPKRLEEKPLDVLLELGNILLVNRPFPNVIYIDPITNEPNLGLDAGGLRRQLVSTLVENLFKEDSGFDFIETSGGKLPTSKNKNALKTFGRLIALCATSSMMLGAQVDPNFLRVLLKYQADWDDKRIFNNLMGISSERKFTEIDEDYPIVEPFKIAANEAISILRDRSTDPLSFIVNVQGSIVTKKRLQSIIRYISASNKIKDFFDRYLEELSPKELAQFHLFITGSLTMNDDPIRIKVYNDRDLKRLPVASTCSKECKLSPYPTYDEFKKKFDIAIQEMSFGFS